MINGMKQQISINQTIDDVMSQNGALLRGLSPVGNQLDGMSFDGTQDPTHIYQNYMDFGRENSNSVSPHSRRVNQQRGANFNTHYGNFLYQVDAKQFPGGNG